MGLFGGGGGGFSGAIGGAALGGAMGGSIGLGADMLGIGTGAIGDLGNTVMGLPNKLFGSMKVRPDYGLIPQVDKNAFILPRGLAAAQTQRGFQQAQQAALGQIAASRGVNPALMMRQGQRASEGLYNQAMQQGQIANLAEAQQAQQNLMSYQQMLQDAGKAKLQAQVGAAQANAQTNQGLFGGIGTSIAGIAGALSDKNAKKDFKQDDKTIEMILDAFSKSKQWKYKDESNGKGEYVGPMAQDLEKAKPDMVAEGQDGMKQVDMNKALMAIMAAQGHLHKKIKKLEKEA